MKTNHPTCSECTFFEADSKNMNEGFCYHDRPAASLVQIGMGKFNNVSVEKKVGRDRKACRDFTRDFEEIDCPDEDFLP